MVRNWCTEKASKSEKLVKELLLCFSREVKISFIQHETSELLKTLSLEEWVDALFQKMLRERGGLSRSKESLLHQQSTEDVISMGLLVQRMDKFFEDRRPKIFEIKLLLEQAVRMATS